MSVNVITENVFCSHLHTYVVKGQTLTSILRYTSPSQSMKKMPLKQQPFQYAKTDAAQTLLFCNALERVFCHALNIRMRLDCYLIYILVKERGFPISKK